MPLTKKIWFKIWAKGHTDFIELRNPFTSNRFSHNTAQPFRNYFWCEEGGHVKQVSYLITLSGQLTSTGCKFYHLKTENYSFWISRKEKMTAEFFMTKCWQNNVTEVREGHKPACMATKLSYLAHKIYLDAWENLIFANAEKRRRSVPLFNLHTKFNPSFS